jgi:hypothetical protein
MKRRKHTVTGAKEKSGVFELAAKSNSIGLIKTENNHISPIRNNVNTEKILPELIP